MEEKQHPGSQKKIEKARKDGKVLKSQLLTQALVVCVAVLLLLGLQKYIIRNFMFLVTNCWFKNSTDITYCLNLSYKGFLTITAIFLFAFFISSILIEFLQVGFKIEFSIVKFKLKNLNLFTNTINIFKKLKDGPLIFIKLFINIVFFTCLFLYYIKYIVESFTIEKEKLFNLVFYLNYNILSTLIFCFLIIGFIDYLFKYRKFRIELSMSEQEVRDEYKNLEGDPFIKSQRAAMHEQLLSEEIVERVKESKVIIVERNS